MKKFIIILNSTIFMVLFSFSDSFSLPLTRSCYTPPEDKIDISLTEQFVYIAKMKRKDIFSFNTGIGSYSSIGSDFTLIHNDSLDAGDGVPGDILFNLWHFIGESSEGGIRSGISFVYRIPTGPDAYTNEKYRNLALGNSEFKITPVLTFSLSEKEILISNISYTFREGGGEDLFSGFRHNLMEGKAESLKNDYASISAGVITSRLFPWIMFSELYYSSGFDNNSDGINIEGESVKPLLLSAGMKYFFSDSIFIQIADNADLLKNEGYIKNTVEFSLNIFF